MNMFLPARLTHVSHACTGTHTSTHLDSGWAPSTPLFYIYQLSSSCKGERKTGRTKQADKCLQKHLYAWGRNGASDTWYSNVHSAVQQAHYMCTSLCTLHYIHKQLSIKGHKPNTPHPLYAMYMHIHYVFVCYIQLWMPVAAGTSYRCTVSLYMQISHCIAFKRM